MGYICIYGAYEIGRMYNTDITIYKNVLSICRYCRTDGMSLYEVATNEPDKITVLRKIGEIEFARLCTGLYTDSNGSRLWYVRGRLHRHDGPAVILSDGDKFWYQNDYLHREDGPAVIYTCGTKEWWTGGNQSEPPLR